MHNFRQFAGKQAIDFATDSIKNITIVMGENGAGKTTLAQAFLWALYGENDFKVKELINRTVRDGMRPNDEIYVKVDLDINHDDRDYIVTRRQKFRREHNGVKDYNVEFAISYKKNGQQEFMDKLDAEKLIKNMLPRELSKFFFFDGERIKTMSDEIEKGRSHQFADAVKGLVGLTALMNAVNHLKPSNSNNTVIGRYNNKMDQVGNAKIAEYSKRITHIENSHGDIKRRVDEVEPQITYYQDEIAKLKQEILSYSDDVNRREQYERLDKEILKLQVLKRDAVRAFLSYCNKNTQAFLVKPLIEQALTELSSSDKLDKGIPDMHQKTVNFLLKRGFCVCGTKLDAGSDSVKELYKLIDYLPPKSIGTMINQFAESSKHKNKQSEIYFEMFTNSFKRIREIENSISSKSREMVGIYNILTDTSKVKALKEKQSEYEKNVHQLNIEHKSKSQRLWELEKEQKQLETEKNKLILVDEKNKEYEVYRQYAIILHEELFAAYNYQEMVTRENLEKYINEIFMDIYESGIAISVDDKYKIKVSVKDGMNSGDELERSTAQNYSVIFAFIAGIIRMAKEKSQEISNSGKEVSEDDRIFTEAAGYPLVMDAPLSAFDKKRIKNICDTLPKIAQQIVFFIKDTDGDVAEAHLGEIIGAKYLVKKSTLTQSEICIR